MKSITIKQPDDWHVHLREGLIFNSIVEDTSKVFRRCVAMPNLETPLTNWELAKKYQETINLKSSLKVLTPCYLTDNTDLLNLSEGLKNKYFFGAKLYPVNTTTNSKSGIKKIENIFPSLEILEKNKAPLLIHGEKISSDIDIFDRERYFIDTELKEILKRFQNLKIVLEHVSSSYGADFIAQTNNNLAATITIHHLLLTKNDVFKEEIDPHLYCMPIVKSEKDLITLRKYACSGNKKFFLGTDSAPHDIKYKNKTISPKPGIYTSPIALEMYTKVFEEENSLINLEKFSSINGPNFYQLPINNSYITLIKEEWINSKFTENGDIKIKNFLGGEKITWKKTNVFNKK